MADEHILNRAGIAGEDFPKEGRSLGYPVKINVADGKLYLAKDNNDIVGVTEYKCNTYGPIMKDDCITYVQSGRIRIYVDPSQATPIKSGQKVGISANGFAVQSDSGKFRAMGEGTPNGGVHVSFNFL